MTLDIEALLRKVLNTVFIRYVLASVASLAVDYSVYLALSETTSRSVAAAVGYAAGIIVHYILSIRVVFQQRGLKDKQAVEFAFFLFTGIVGIAITYGVVWLHDFVGGTNKHIAKLLAIFVSFFVVFLMRKYLIFCSEKPRA